MAILRRSRRARCFQAAITSWARAGYVAIEVVTGTLAGRKGTFALQQMATMDKSGQKLQVVVVPGSGTDGLKGISGTFAITIADGKHSYDLEYELPE